MLPAAVTVALTAAFVVFDAKAEEAVAVQYHFAGAAELSKDPNFETAAKIFRAPSSTNFESLVLDRLSRVFWSRLPFEPKGEPVEVLRPLLEDLWQCESVASFGAAPDNLSFVLAARLDNERAQLWHENLKASMQGGEPYTSEGYSGMQWSNGFWMVQAPDWVVVGTGDGLDSVRADYLQQLHKTGRPWPALKDNWFQAVIDWPLLTAGNPATSIPLKPARTTLDMTATGGRFHITAYLSYPEAVPWTSQPWQIPKNLPRAPLTSFTAAQGVEPYLQLDPVFSKLATDPFTNQFFCWAQPDVAFQTYMAWPVNNASNVLKDLSRNGIALLNPILAKGDGSKLAWSPADSAIIWKKSSLMMPFLRVGPETGGNFLEAGLFVPEEGQPVPADLWAQFENRNDLVYYNWEKTSARVRQLRSISQIIRILPPVSGSSNTRAAGKVELAPLLAVEEWLGGLESDLGNTVTEISRTAPDELTVVRSAPFVFTGLEIVWLSHWLANVPAGPVNPALIPRAIISAPGMPKH
jgi:hypothetical protein